MKYGYKRGALHHDFSILQTNEGDKKSDTCGYCVFQIHGNGIENSFTHIGKRQCDEDKTFHEYGCQSHLPGITHLEYYGVCKISIQSHAGRQHKG